MSGRLHGRTAIVTGGARGIGYATVQRFADEGARVVLTDWSEQRGKRAAETLTAQGYDVAFQHHDAGDEESWLSVMKMTAATFGVPHILVNNAYSGAARPFADVSVQDYRDAMRVNLEGAVIGMQLAARAMVEGGAIVNLSSIAALGGSPGNSPYAAAKLAVVSITKAAAIELGRRNPPIRVNAVAPGMTRTPALEKTIQSMQRLPSTESIDKELENLSARVPLRRVAEPSELAGAILFLASPDASYVTGHCLVVDGGATI